MTKAQLIKLGLLGSIAVALAGCGGGGSSTGSTPAPVVISLEQRFGNQFAIDFAAGPNTLPVAVPMAGDIIPLSLTTDPIALHN